MAKIITFPKEEKNKQDSEAKDVNCGPEIPGFMCAAPRAGIENPAAQIMELTHKRTMSAMHFADHTAKNILYQVRGLPPIIFHLTSDSIRQISTGTEQGYFEYICEEIPEWENVSSCHMVIYLIRNNSVAGNMPAGEIEDIRCSIWRKRADGSIEALLQDVGSWDDCPDMKKMSDFVKKNESKKDALFAAAKAKEAYILDLNPNEAKEFLKKNRKMLKACDKKRPGMILMAAGDELWLSISEWTTLKKNKRIGFTVYEGNGRETVFYTVRAVKKYLDGL